MNAQQLLDLKEQYLDLLRRSRDQYDCDGIGTALAALSDIQAALACHLGPSEHNRLPKTSPESGPCARGVA
jgi:hypothetical protein